MKIQFVIKGNQENREGNPIPYYRSTKGSFWNKGTQRYNAWKEFVKYEFLKSCGNNQLCTGKPIVLGTQKARMDLMIHFKDHTHADCDNIFKGIADALFKNDKRLIGSFDYVIDPNKKGFVEVNIEY
jgi:hypothetical protein